MPRLFKVVAWIVLHGTLWYTELLSFCHSPYALHANGRADPHCRKKRSQLGNPITLIRLLSQGCLLLSACIAYNVATLAFSPYRCFGGITIRATPNDLIYFIVLNSGSEFGRRGICFLLGVVVLS